MTRSNSLAIALNLPGSFISRYTPPRHSRDSLFELLVIHSAPRVDVEFHDLPAIFRPFSETEGYDYSKVYVDDMSYYQGHGYAYQNYGMDSEDGCVVLLRPDQYVSWVGALEDIGEMDHFFSDFMN